MKKVLNKLSNFKEITAGECLIILINMMTWILINDVNMCTIHIKSGHMWYSGTFSVYTYITVYIHIPNIARLSIRHIKHCA